MNTDTGAYALGGGGMFWIAQQIWRKVFSTPEKAHDQLVTQLAAEIADLRLRQDKLEQALDDERKRRRSAEDKVHALELDNLQLRATLKQHDIELPPSFVVAP
ncbi:hypothetical protein [Solilutibacter silvestris]|uniref:hypothetical protein n=1 Tax=Solilutibacter silvestris TaxID=1645665 RepID=UPI003D34DA77